MLVPRITRIWFLMGIPVQNHGSIIQSFMSVKIYMDTLTLFIFYKPSLKWVDIDIPNKH